MNEDGYEDLHDEQVEIYGAHPKRCRCGGTLFSFDEGRWSCNRCGVSHAPAPGRW